MFGKLLEAAGFFSRDFARYWAQRSLHSSLLITEFAVAPAFSSPDGKGFRFEFALENKLQSLNNVADVLFSLDGVCVPFTWQGEHPIALKPAERRTYRGQTTALPGKDGDHQYRIEVTDGLGRSHRADYSNHV